MVATDPTLDSLELLKDPSKVHKVANVPIFIPHIRKDPETGEELYRITEERLKDIAAVCNSRAAEGVHGKLQIGHTKKGAPQQDQPPLVGLYHNYRPAFFGPKKKPGLLADFYYFKKDFEEAKKYPFRSAEFYPNTNEITAVALLMNDPELDMGMLLFERKGPCYFYSSKELPMDNEFANQVVPDEKFDEAEANRFMMYMKKCYPKFHEQYGAGPGMASGSNSLPGHVEYQRNGNGVAVTTPATAGMNGHATPAASPLVKENAELYERTGKLEAELSILRADSKAIQYERRLTTLDPDGVAFDHKVELADLRTMTDGQVESHFKRLERQAQYSRSPVGQGFIRTEGTEAERLAEARANAPMTAYEKAECVTLCTERAEQGKPITVGEALVEIRKK